MRNAGYIPGRISSSSAGIRGREERAPALAAELVSLKPDLLVVDGTIQVRAAKQATSTLPIVMVESSIRWGRGLVASLARPGGNVTGPTDQLMEMEGNV